MIDTIYLYQMNIKDKPGMVDLSGYLTRSKGIPVSNRIMDMLQRKAYTEICDHILTTISGTDTILEKYDLFPIGQNDVIALVDSGDSTNCLIFTADAGRLWELKYSPVHNKLLYKEVI